MAKKLARVMTITSRLATWASSWAMTPSSSAGERSSMIPWSRRWSRSSASGRSRRRSASGVRDGDLRLGQVGLDAQALDHRVELGRLLRAHLLGAHRAHGELVGGEELEGKDPAGDDDDDGPADPRGEERPHQDDVDEAERNSVSDIRG